MWHIIGECLERSRSMEGWERWVTRSRCEVQENVFERTEEDVFSREANNTYGYMGEGNYASNIKKQGKSHTSGLTKPNMEGIQFPFQLFVKSLYLRIQTHFVIPFLGYSIRFARSFGNICAQKARFLQPRQRKEVV